MAATAAHDHSDFRLRPLSLQTQTLQTPTPPFTDQDKMAEDDHKRNGVAAGAVARRESKNARRKRLRREKEGGLPSSSPGEGGADDGINTPMDVPRELAVLGVHESESGQRCPARDEERVQEEIKQINLQLHSVTEQLRLKDESVTEQLRLKDERINELEDRIARIHRRWK